MCQVTLYKRVSAVTDQRLVGGLLTRLPDFLCVWPEAQIDAGSQDRRFNNYELATRHQEVQARAKRRGLSFWGVHETERTPRIPA